MNKVEMVKRVLSENLELALELARECDWRDGSFDFVDTWDLEEYCHCAEDKFELVRSVVYGNVNNIYDPVRLNAYGNLESVDDYELQSEIENYYLDDIANKVVELYEENDITINNVELLEILEMEEDDEEENEDDVDEAE